MKLYVEGGGDAKLLRSACRQGFSDFLRKAGLGSSMPRIVACGSRRNAYDDFCTETANGRPAMLLVDSEEPISASHQQGPSSSWKPWLHLRHRVGDGWEQPSGTEDSHCHLMVLCMESWLLAHPEQLALFYGHGFNASKLPSPAAGVEGIAKDQIYRSLEAATKGTRSKGSYRKGAHSFALLSLVEPDRIMAASPWARRFIEEAKTKMGC